MWDEKNRSVKWIKYLSYDTEGHGLSGGEIDEETDEQKEEKGGGSGPEINTNRRWA